MLLKTVILTPNATQNIHKTDRCGKKKQGWAIEQMGTVREQTALAQQLNYEPKPLASGFQLLRFRRA